MSAIDVGAAAINRVSSFPQNYTCVEKSNPANDTGAIDTVEIWANSNLNSSTEVASFFVVSGNNLSTRDSEAIGAVTAGSKQTFTGLDMGIESGDHIGIFYNGGKMENDASGGVLMWYQSGDKIPCTNQLFASDATNYIISLYGIGATVGWVGGDVNGVANAAIGKINGVAIADILKVNGVA